MSELSFEPSDAHRPNPPIPVRFVTLHEKRAKFAWMGAPARVVRDDGTLDDAWLERHHWITLNGHHRDIGSNRPWYYKVWGRLHYPFWRWRHPESRS